VEPFTRRLERTEVPAVRLVVKRLVLEAVVLKELVEVAAVVVERLAMKPPVKVEEAVEMKPPKKPRVVVVETPQGWTVQEKEEPVVSGAQPKTPPDQVRKLPAVQLARPKPLMLVPERLVVEAVPEKRAEVVALTAVKFCKVEEPLTSRLAKVAAPDVRLVEKRLVEEAVVEKRLVVVALTAVKFWRVEEPLTRRLVKTDEPAVRAVAERLVEEAFVAKKLVVVALVPVALLKVKFCKVVEPFTRRLERTEVPAVRLVVKRLVEEAVVA